MRVHYGGRDSKGRSVGKEETEMANRKERDIYGGGGGGGSAGSPMVGRLGEEKLQQQ